MRRKLIFGLLPVLALAGWVLAQPSADPIVEGFRNVEVASVADAMEQMYGQKNYMSHDHAAAVQDEIRGTGR